MNTLNLIILLVCINIIINVILCIAIVYNFDFVRKSIYVFDDIIHSNFKHTCKINEFINKFDKAFFDENKFKEGDAAFVGIITRVDNNDKNKIKDKTDKK